jgi:hypothetical protein
MLIECKNKHPKEFEEFNGKLFEHKGFCDVSSNQTDENVYQDIFCNWKEEDNYINGICDYDEYLENKYRKCVSYEMIMVI